MRLLSVVLPLLITLQANAQTPITIAEARTKPIGTVVTVSGRVTVGAQFGGPAYFQDATAGLAVFYAALHNTAQIGDSLVVTGPLSEFQATSGQPGSGLMQISCPASNPGCVTFTLFPEGRRIVAPRVVTLSQISESVEGQLVRIRSATIEAGAFQANSNYPIRDATGARELRIDNDTDLVGVNAPTGPTDVVAVVSQFRGTYQILPRSTADLGVQAQPIPGEDIPRNRTFEMMTWNLRFFGDPTQPPGDDALALRNAARVIRTVDADVVALQEISNLASFRTLVDSLPGYRGFVAPITQTQKTAFLYKTATVDSLSSGFLVTTGDWASGRYPFSFSFNATVEGVTRRMRAINIHAKATTTNPPNDYTRRVQDAQQLKDFLDQNMPAEAIVVLGDFNDDIDVSTVGGNPSPYSGFVQDPAYHFVTQSLSERRFFSYGSGGEMIDHIMISDELIPDWFEGTERVENPSYIPSYLSTTSDHYPVWVRFDLARVTSTATLAERHGSTRLRGSHPNPFRDATTFTFDLAHPARIRLEVFDVLGRSVALLHDGAEIAGTHTARFETSDLPPGLYLVRLTTPDAMQSLPVLKVR